MKKIIILLLCIGASFLANAQTITIKDKETGEPLELVNLTSKLPKAIITTNIYGQTDISVFKNAEKIEIRKVGYKTQTLTYAAIANMNFELLLTVAITNFDEVVVSATRWKQYAKKVPAKITTISAKDVAVFNPQTTADLLGSSGEVFIQKSQQGGGSPMIRGFATNRLLYTIDGVRMNSAIFRAGNIQNVISVDPLALQSTEVFFGPGSIIYGSDAIGGVMSFQTLTPQFSQTDKVLIAGKAQSRYSSANNESTNHFDVNLGWKKWASVTSLSHSKFGNLRMGKNGPDGYLKPFTVKRVGNVDQVFENTDSLVQDPSGYSQLNLMQKIRFSPNKNWDLQYGFHYSESSEYARYDRLIELQSNGLPASAVWNYGPQIWRMNNLSITNNNENVLYNSMTIRLAEQHFEESRIDRRFNHHRLRTQLEKVQAYSANVDFEKNLNNNKLYYGVEYVLNKVKSIGTAVDIRDRKPILVADRYPTSDWSSYAAYLNYQHVISEQLLLQAGVRYNAFNIKSDFTRQLAFFPYDFTTASIKNGATTGSIGAVYTPEETWKISLNGSTGFRAPNVDDIGKIFDFATGDVVVPNPNLKAEYAYNAELNVSKIFGDVIKLDVTGFYTYLDNAMVRRAFTVNGSETILYNGVVSKVYAIQNAAHAKVYGFNAGVEIKLPAGFGLVSKYNYQLGKEEMDNGNIMRSRHSAPAFGLTRLTYQKDKLTMQFYAMYSAKVSNANLNEEERLKPVIYAKDDNGNPYSPSWYTLNFKAMHQFHQNLAVSAGVENLTDQRYRPYSSGLVAPGRNFVLSLNANF